MNSLTPNIDNAWDQQASQLFIDYGRYFVPERERQLEFIVELLPCKDQACTIMELFGKDFNHVNHVNHANLRDYSARHPQS